VIFKTTIVIGMVRSLLGGDSVLAECRKLLKDLNIDIVPQYLVAEKVSKWRKR